MRFSFTLHPSDVIRVRLLPGTHGLLVASSLWRSGRLRVRRPPAGVLASLALDSGGFTATRTWGQYPCSAADDARWARTLVAERPVDWVAIMDDACEPGVNREIWQPTGRECPQAARFSWRLVRENAKKGFL